MGFWQGVAEAYKDISAERTRARELEENRAFEKEMFMKKVEENRRDKLIELSATRKKSKTNATEISGKAQELIKMLDPEDERTKVFVNDPVLAAATYDAVRKANEARVRNEKPTLTPEEILKISTYTDQSGKPKLSPDAPSSIEEINNLDLSNPEEYAKALKSLQPQSEDKPFVAVPPEYFSPDTGERTEKAIKTLDDMVMVRAYERLDKLGQDDKNSTEYAQLAQLIDAGLGGGKGAELAMVRLRAMYGREIIDNMNQQDQETLYKSPVIRELFPQDQNMTPKDLPNDGGVNRQLQRDEAISQFVNEYSNPNTTEERRLEIRESFSRNGVEHLLPKLKTDTPQQSRAERKEELSQLLREFSTASFERREEINNRLKEMGVYDAVEKFKLENIQRVG
jgi:hypothetical protein